MGRGLIPKLSLLGGIGLQIGGEEGYGVDRSRVISLRVLEDLFSQADMSRVGIRLWDGTPWPDKSPKSAALVLNHPGALRRMFLPGSELGLAEAYLYDDFDIEGDVESVFHMAEALASAAQDFKARFKLGLNLLRLPRAGRDVSTTRGRSHMSGERHSIARDRQAIAYHYDVSNDFYSLWLDPNMVYSCGYFHKREDSLDEAQIQKMDHICRKLRLQAGQRLLDIGCGWGGLVTHAARHYGVRVLGITLSQPQVDLASERIAEAGLEGKCRVALQDYRELDEWGGFDALSSVGMFEHVGEARLETYFRQAYDLLRPGGAFLNHGITRRATDSPRSGRSFSDVYVFPDGELVPISTSLRVAEGVGFEVRDVESLREHYAITLRHWVRRLEKAHARALEFVDEPTYRVWRLFMSGSAYGFSTGRLNVYQALLVKPGLDGRSGLPLTRDDLYGACGEPAAPQRG
jgi:cyclopropane-fatty-acyl-phospholipid synthase